MVKELQIMKVVARGRAVRYAVVCSLNIEGLFDFGVGCDDEVQKDQEYGKKGEDSI